MSALDEPRRVAPAGSDADERPSASRSDGKRCGGPFTLLHLGAAALAWGLFSAGLVLLMNLVDRHYWHADDALNEFGPYSREISRIWFSGHLPVLTTRSFAGGNLLVDFERSAFHPVMLLISVSWQIVDNMHRIAMIFAFLTLFFVMVGGYVLGRVAKLNTFYAALLGLTTGTLPVVVFFYASDWWNGALGSVSFVWALTALLWAQQRPCGSRLWWLGVASWGIFAAGWPTGYIAWIIVVLVAAISTAMNRSGGAPRPILRGVYLAASAGLGGLLSYPLLSEYLALSTVLDRPQGYSNGGNFLVPMVGQILGMSNPFSGDWWSTFQGYDYSLMPVGFVTVGIVVALFLTAHRPAILGEFGVRQVAIMTGILYLLTQSPSVVGPTRWPFRYLPFAQTLLALLVFYYLNHTARQWSWRRVGLLSGFVAVQALWSSWRVPNTPTVDWLRTLVFPLGILVVIGGIAILFRFERARKQLLTLLCVSGTVGLFLQMPPMAGGSAAWGTPPQRSDLAELASMADGGFIVSVVDPAFDVSKSSPAGTIFSARFLIGGVATFSGYDPVGYKPFSNEFHPRSAHNILGVQQLDYLTQRAPEFGSVCYASILNVSAVLIAATVPTELLDRLRGCGFSQGSDIEGKWVFVADQGVAGTASVASPGVALSNPANRSDTTSVVHVDNTQDNVGKVLFSRMYYPGYTARLNGQILPVSALGSMIVQVTVPPHSQGDLTVTYTPTSWPRAWYVAGLAGVLLVLVAVISRIAAEPRHYGEQTQVK